MRSNRRELYPIRVSESRCGWIRLDVSLSHGIDPEVSEGVEVWERGSADGSGAGGSFWAEVAAVEEEDLVDEVFGADGYACGEVADAESEDFWEGE
jgi:hypothetical protein